MFKGNNEGLFYLTVLVMFCNTVASAIEAYFPICDKNNMSFLVKQINKHYLTICLLAELNFSLLPCR